MEPFAGVLNTPPSYDRLGQYGFVVFFGIFRPIHFAFMLTVRHFRNEDSPKLLEIWQKRRHGPGQSRFFSMSMEKLDIGPLAMPFFNRHWIQLAFADDRPVGFVQAGLGPNGSGSDLSSDTGHIAMVVIDPECPEPVAVCGKLIQASERVLADSGVCRIYGGSPHPSLPFYLGLYGGAEPIGVFDADTAVGEAFRSLGYGVYQKTIRFQRELTNYFPPFLPTMLPWKSKLRLIIDDWPTAKNWWDALSLVRPNWMESTAILKESDIPIAQIRLHANEPEEGPIYRNSWNIALMDLRVHPNFRRQGVGTYLLAETLRYLIAKSRAARVEAHVAENHSELCGLLKSLDWSEVETGTIFFKKI